MDNGPNISLLLTLVPVDTDLSASELVRFMPVLCRYRHLLNSFCQRAYDHPDQEPDDDVAPYEDSSSWSDTPSTPDLSPDTTMQLDSSDADTIRSMVSNCRVPLPSDLSRLIFMQTLTDALASGTGTKVVVVIGKPIAAAEAQRVA